MKLQIIPLCDWFAVLVSKACKQSPWFHILKLVYEALDASNISCSSCRKRNDRECTIIPNLYHLSNHFTHILWPLIRNIVHATDYRRRICQPQDSFALDCLDQQTPHRARSAIKASTLEVEFCGGISEDFASFLVDHETVECDVWLIAGMNGGFVLDDDVRGLLHYCSG